MFRDTWRTIHHRLGGHRNSSDARRRRPQSRVGCSVERLEDRSLLAAFIVNTTLDTVNANPGNGQAVDTLGRTSLRAAIMEANATDGPHTIELPEGIYRLTRAGSGENAAATGDLDITNDVTIIGAGEGRTIIDAGGNTGIGDRIFEIVGGTVDFPVVVDLRGMTLTGGRALGTLFPHNRGGAIQSSQRSDLRISDVAFIDNRAPALEGTSAYGSGGAIASGLVMSIENSRFENNHASNSGGAIYAGVSGTVIEIRNSTFESNTARSGGAIKTHVTMTVDGSTFSNNRADGQGGAIDNNGNGRLTLTNSTVSGNQSPFGGGIYNVDTLQIVNSTIAHNTALYAGGGIDQSGSLTVTNSIIANNAAGVTAPTSPNVDGSAVSRGNNLIGNPAGSSGFGAAGDLLNTDPKLLPLADNGGRTWTHALAADSPAVDAAQLAAAPATDQRGVSRPQGTAADIGAFEFVVAGNRPPVAEDFTATIDEDNLLRGQLIATDPDDDPLTFQLATTPANGSAQVAADGRFVYAPAFNFYGTDSFTYQVSDGRGNNDTATVQITINPVNDAPFVASPTFTTQEDQPLTAAIEYLDVEGDPASFAVELPPEYGTVVFDPENPGTFTYLPALDFYGTDSFVFRASDDQGDWRLGTVTLIITPVNDAPVAGGDAFRIDQGETLVIDASPMFQLTMQSEPGDWVGAGRSWSFSDDDASFTARRNFDSGVSLQISGSSFWGLDFAAPLEAELARGLYADAMRFPFQDNDKPGLDVSGDGRGHNALTGHFTVHEIDYGTATSSGQPIRSFAATFVQQGMRSDGTVEPPLRGSIQYNTAIGTGAGILENDTDVDGDFLTAVLVDGPRHGSLMLNPDGTLSYTPNEDFYGTDSFTYRANDGQLQSNVATVSITVDRVNRPPVAGADVYNIDQRTTLEIAAPGLLRNDTDPDGDALTAILVNAPSNGTLVLNADGSFSYSPAAGFHGTDSFTYRASDGQLQSAVATVSIIVDRVNRTPLAGDDTYNVDQRTTLAIAASGVLDNDTDPDGDALTAVLVDGPSNGTLVLNADGSFSYTPTGDYHGSDSFTYEASDGELRSATATVSITVGRVNRTPLAGDDTYNVDQRTTLAIAASGVLGNDTDPDGDALTAVLVDGPSNGTLTLNADGSFSYTPTGDYHGSDSFTYEASDGELRSATATVSITVGRVNRTPLAGDDTYNVDQRTTLAIAASGVLGNDTDPDGDALTAVLVDGPSNGTLTLNADGSFSYTPTGDYHGSDSFTYEASDGELRSATATVSITVGRVNRNPLAGDDTYNVDQRTTLAIAASGVLDNDTDPDGDALTAVLVDGPSNGTLVLNADGSFSYTPTGDYHGSDSFTYEASDGELRSATATVSIIVDRVNRTPLVGDDTYNVAQRTTLAIAASGVLGNDTDPDGDALTAVLVDGPSNGTLVLNADGSFSYTPTGDYHGSDSFTYQASDGELRSATATVSITVGRINRNPVAGDDTYNVDQRTTLEIVASGVLDNDTDPDGDALTAVLVDGPSNGTLVLNADGSFSYTPTGDYHGSDSFTYRASDGALQSAVATVSIIVDRMNRNPVAGDDTYNVDQRTTLEIAASGVLDNDTDPDGDALTAVLVDGPSNGTLVLNADGSFSYTPTGDYHGSDSFTYQASDGELRSATATVSITVGRINRNPLAGDDTYNVDQRTTLAIAASGVLGNDTDPDGDALTAVLVDGPSNGTLTLNADGSFSYTPTGDYHGSDSFTYEASDGELRSATATVSITVGRVNRTPLAGDDTYNVDQRTTLAIAASGVLGNDTDPDGDALTAVLVDGPSNGTLTLNADGSFSYTPTGDYHGSDSFTYRASDGELRSAVVTVSIIVNPLIETLVVPIDIRPGGGPNPINPKSAGTVQVVILSTESFEATRDLDVESLTFGRTGEEMSLARKKKDGVPDTRYVDLNGDGRLDLLAIFVTQEANFQAGDAEGILRGRTFEGRTFEGRDTVMIVGVPQGDRGEGEPSLPPELLDAIWHNWALPMDASGDRIITPADALMIINAVGRGPGGVLPRGANAQRIDFPYLDTNNDGQVTPLDALLVLNHLARQNRSPGAQASEGESGWAAQADAAHALNGEVLAGLLHHDEVERRRRG